MTMTCLTDNPKGPDLLIAYFEGTLDPREARELDRHFEECAECRGFRDAWDALDEFAAPPVSASFDDRLYARIARESRKPAWMQWLSLEGFSWKRALPIGAACAALAIALMIHAPESDEPPVKAKVETVNPVNIEQVEQALEDLDLLAPVNGAAQL